MDDKRLDEIEARLAEGIPTHPDVARDTRWLIARVRELEAEVEARSEPKDWTCNEQGRSNSSQLFLLLVDEIDHFIFDAHNFHSPALARLIMAQLAHKWSLVPSERARESDGRVGGGGA